jgi:hypothetical protein
VDAKKKLAVKNKKRTKTKGKVNQCAKRKAKADADLKKRFKAKEKAKADLEKWKRARAKSKARTNAEISVSISEKKKANKQKRKADEDVKAAEKRLAKAEADEKKAKQAADKAKAEEEKAKQLAEEQAQKIEELKKELAETEKEIAEAKAELVMVRQERKKTEEQLKQVEREVVKEEVQEVVVQEPPEEPSDNDFGYEEPVWGCFEGEVMFVEPQTPKLPADYSKYEVASKVYACEWDIPKRAFDKGFPGVEGKFEWFAIRYSGRFKVDKGGTYTFRINSDDGTKLYIDGNLVVNNDGVHPPRVKSGTVELTAGDHELVLEYFQGPRYLIALQVYVTPPAGEEAIFSVR